MKQLSYSQQVHTAWLPVLIICNRIDSEQRSQSENSIHDKMLVDLY